ncbi:MAG TPA: RNA polymerase sigma factor [Rhizomicrobium sp.]|nr:RNA polymerase sigma factor [Rhizomicrobium sp.]
MDASLDTIRHQMVQLLPRLRRFAIVLTGSPADGDDLVQDTVERALKNLHAWEPGTRLDSWMFRIAKNRFIDNCRSASRAKTVTIDAADDAAALDGEQAMQSHLAFQDTAAALQTLPAEQRQAVALVLVDGLSYRQAADILEIPIGTLTSRISRARQALLTALEG